MKSLNLKKVNRFILLAYLAIAVLFCLGALQKLIRESVFGIRYIIWFAGLFAIGFVLVFIYTKHLEKCQVSGKKSFGYDFLQTIYKYRFLIEQLVLRDFKIKYKRSVLGVFWSFLNPLLMMVVQYIVFSHLLNMRGNVEHYAIYLLCGIVMWNGFNDCSQQSMRSITGNASLITKVYVPKTIYPVSKVLSAAINVCLSMIPLLLVSLIYGIFSKPHLILTNAVLLLPFGLIFLLIFCIGMGFLLSALMVFFHDVEFLWGVISTIWMYATPIIYSLSMFESKAAWLVKIMQFNPLYHYIGFVRSIILEGTSPAFSEYLICAGFSVLMFGFGYFIFKKLQDKFILYL